MSAEPAAGAFVATIVLCALLAPPVFLLAVIVWLMVRVSKHTSSRSKPEVDHEFSARFQELEEGILNTD